MVAGRKQCSFLIEQIGSRSVGAQLAQRPSPALRALFSARGNRVVTFGRLRGTRQSGPRAPDVWLTTLPAAETAAISRDGGFVATVGYGGEATLWSAEARG